MDLPCLNCKKPLGASPKIFAQCVLCDNCERVARLLHDSVYAELQQLQQTAKELIRQAILRGHLSLPSPVRAGEQPQSVLLEILRQCQTTNSPTSRPQSSPQTSQLELPLSPRSTTPDASLAPTQAAVGPEVSSSK